MLIDAKNVYYKDLNKLIREKIKEGIKLFKIINVNGQRYIADGITGNIKFEVNGIAGNDLGAFMNGAEVIVNGNAQDAIANTMNCGKIVINGHAGDALCYGMRGGEVFIRDNVGYRVGIHMKEYKSQKPVLVIGGGSGNFLGEYMAGGILILFGIENKKHKQDITGDYFATGMHGGVIYTRTAISENCIGKEVKRFAVDKADIEILKKYANEFTNLFNVKTQFDFKSFSKYIPISKRPYGRLYVNA